MAGWTVVTLQIGSHVPTIPACVSITSPLHLDWYNPVSLDYSELSSQWLRTAYCATAVQTLDLPRGLRVDDTQVVTALVRRCVAGEADAWEEIVQQFNRRIYNVCYRFTGSPDNADDLAQEVFIKLYRTLESYSPEKGSFPTWVMTMTRNLLVDHFRKSKQDRVTDSLDAGLTEEEDSISLGDKLQDSGPGADERIQRRETQEMVQKAIQKLSPELREAVILRDLQDMDYKEIAVALKVPEGTVKSRINRGRMELARLLSRTYRQVT